MHLKDHMELSCKFQLIVKDMFVIETLKLKDILGMLFWENHLQRAPVEIKDKWIGATSQHLALCV